MNYFLMHLFDYHKFTKKNKSDIKNLSQKKDLKLRSYNNYLFVRLECSITIKCF